MRAGVRMRPRIVELHAQAFDLLQIMLAGRHGGEQVPVHLVDAKRGVMLLRLKPVDDTLAIAQRDGQGGDLVSQCGEQALLLGNRLSQGRNLRFGVLPDGRDLRFGGLVGGGDVLVKGGDPRLRVG